MARIGISAVALDPGRTGGAETYMRQLMGCPAFTEALAGHEALLFAGRPCDPVLEQSGLKLVRCPVDPSRRIKRLLWEQYALPGILNRHQLDLVHFPYSGFSWNCRQAMVVTVHDTADLIMPGSVSLAERMYRALLQRRLVRHPRASVIIPSKTDREIFISHLDFPHERCFPVRHGRPRGFLIGQDEVGLSRPAGGLLWVGRAYGHKNVDLLFDVAAHLSRRMGRNAPRLRLVGIEPPAARRMAALARKLGVPHLADMEGPVPHETLPAYYRQARVLVYPSAHESFGLPPLEAMCSGTPVVCSDIPVFREILGEAALYADPARPETFADACAALLENADLWARQASKGHDCAQRYTWSRCAQETAAVYEQALRSTFAPR